MKVVELYSQRQTRLNGDLPDTMQYTVIPMPLRNQIFYILQDALGGVNDNDSNVIYDDVYKVLCREIGSDISSRNGKTIDVFLKNIIKNEFINTTYILNFVELIFKEIDTVVRDCSEMFVVGEYGVKISPDSAIKELNHRFKQASVGYRFESGMLVRVDSEFIHSEAVKPVFQLLKKSEFYKGANQEFLHAHELYLNNKYEASMGDCLKSLESLIKGICDQRGWNYTVKDNASKLIAKCFEHGLIPSYMNSEFTALKSLIESGTPTVRNKSAGHGQGAQIREVPEHLVRLTLNLTATHLLFLMECNEVLESNHDEYTEA